MTPVDRVISKFGSIRAVAETLGIDRSAVSLWKQTGYVPTKRQRELLVAAREKGIDLQPADFFDQPATDHEATLAGSPS